MRVPSKYVTKAEFDKLKEDFSTFKDKVKVILKEMKEMIKDKHKKKIKKNKLEEAR